MFEEVGHLVEKIRRVGYGPLVLDVEPGEVRELTAEEVLALRRARGIRRPFAIGCLKSAGFGIPRPEKAFGCKSAPPGAAVPRTDTSAG